MLNIITTITKIVPVAMGLITAVEKIFGEKQGAQKKNSYLEGLSAALSLQFPKELLSDPKFVELLSQLADVIVAISNYIRDKKIENQ